MSQNRTAPAYQEYAANTLAKMPFRKMSLQDRGLFYTIRLECWVNKALPKNIVELSKVLGLDVDEVKASLPAVMPFLEISGNCIICRDLEDYRAHLDERKRKQSQGGKKGSAMTNDKRKMFKENVQERLTNPSSFTSSNSRLSPRGSDESLVQYSAVQTSLNQLSKEKESIPDTFISDYEEYEASQEFANSESMVNESKKSMRL